MLRCVTAEIQEARWQYLSGQSPGEISCFLLSSSFFLISIYSLFLLGTFYSFSREQINTETLSLTTGRDQNDCSIYGWTYDICGEWEKSNWHVFLARDSLLMCFSTPQDGLIKNNMEKLTFYSLSSPEKLDRIGEYLFQRASRDIYR